MISQYDKYQTTGPRIIALVVDGLILLPLSIINIFIVNLNLSPIFTYSWVFIMTLAPSLYTIILHTLYGQTFGKMAAKVKVVDVNENPIMLYHAVLRSLPQIFFSFAVIFFSKSNDDFQMLITVLYAIWTVLNIIVFFVNDKRRALHDFVAGTIVVRLN